MVAFIGDGAVQALQCRNLQDHSPFLAVGVLMPAEKGKLYIYIYILYIIYIHLFFYNTILVHPEIDKGEYQRENRDAPPKEVTDFMIILLLIIEFH